jgi:hypothetical protein
MEIPNIARVSRPLRETVRGQNLMFPDIRISFFDGNCPVFSSAPCRNFHHYNLVSYLKARKNNVCNGRGYFN